MGIREKSDLIRSLTAPAALFTECYFLRENRMVTGKSPNAYPDLAALYPDVIKVKTLENELA